MKAHCGPESDSIAIACGCQPASLLIKGASWAASNAGGRPDRCGVPRTRTSFGVPTFGHFKAPGSKR